MHDLGFMAATGEGGRLRPLLAADARLKVLLAATCLLLVLCSPDARFPVGIALAVLGTLQVMGIGAGELLRRLAPALAFAGLVSLTRVFFAGGEPLLTVQAGGFGLTIYREGLQTGVLLLARVVAGVSLLILLSAVTGFPRLAAALGSLGLPAVLVDLLLMTFRYIFVLGEEAERLRRAARVRLGFAGWRRALNTTAALAGMVLWRAYDRSENVYRAMVARGYTEGVPMAALDPLSGRQALGGAAAALLLVGLFLALNR